MGKPEPMPFKWLVLNHSRYVGWKVHVYVDVIEMAKEVDNFRKSGDDVYVYDIGREYNVTIGANAFPKEVDNG